MADVGGPTATGGAGGSGGRPGPKHAVRRWWTNRWVIAAGAVVVVAAVVGIALASSSGNKATQSPKKPAAVTTTTAAVATCPFTGTPAPGGAVANRPALAIKVDNYPTARPQSGLDKADLVFEEPVEGGITRYVAVFQCQQAPLVGPIRSARYPDVGILSQLSDPVFLHVGGITPIVSMIQGSPVHDENLFYIGSVIQHPPGRYAPYDTYVSTAAAWKLVPQDTKAPAPIFGYSATVPVGTPTASIHIPFSPTSDETWTWSAAAQKWLLSYSGVPDAVAGGSQIATTNVVVIRVNTYNGPYVENSEGALEVEFDPLAGGPAEVLRNGVAVTGTWRRTSLTSPTQLIGANGTPIPLAPGQTWIELVPDDVNITTAPPATTTSG